MKNRYPLAVFLSLTLVWVASAKPASAGDVSLPLTTGANNKLFVGSFAGGTTVTVAMSGNGDLVDSRWTVRPDGSLNSSASGDYSFANPGAAYSQANGGDGINHFPGGGANYDSTGSGYGFAGKMTTDTTDPATIRNGAIVGTFASSPTRADWFLVGNGGSFTVPAGGARLYLAVSDSVPSDNHGTYTGSVSGTAAPEAMWDAGRDLVANEKPDGGSQETMNPNGTVPVWSYGYRDGTIGGTSLTLFQPNVHSNTVSGAPGLEGYEISSGEAVSANTTSQPIVLSFCCGPLAPVAPDEMIMGVNTSGRNTIVRWTAPASGNFTYHADWRDIDPYGGDGAAGYVVVNGVQVFGQSWPNGVDNGATADGTVSMSTGDTIEFLLNNGAQVSFDITRVTFTVNPASITSPTPPPHGGLSPTTFTVNESSTPTSGLADSVLRFRSIQTGAPAGVKVVVEKSTNQTTWTNLSDEAHSLMSYAPQVTSYILHTTNYPTTSGVYFRARASAPGYPGSISNVVGPFDLTSSAAHLSAPLLFTTTNGEVNAIRFGVNQTAIPSGIAVTMQTTQTPAVETSWATAPLGTNGAMVQDKVIDNHQFYLGTDDYPEGEGNYFRAVATAPGYVKAVSITYGPLKFVRDPAAAVTITIESTAYPDGNTIDDAQVVNATGFHMAVQASSGRQILRMTVLYDGATLTSFDTGANRTVDFSATVPGDHIVEAYATDDLGVTGAAPPVHVRVLPSAPGKLYQMTQSGAWNTATNWITINGENGVPGPNDAAIIGSYNPTLATPVTVRAVSLNGGTISGAQLTATSFFTVGAGNIKSDISIPSGSFLELINDADIGLSGTLQYAGTVRLHGKGGITGVKTTSSRPDLSLVENPDGLFDGILGVIKGVGQFIADLASGGRKGSRSAPPPAANPPPARELRTVQAQSISIAGGQLTAVSAPIISHDGGGIISHDGGGIISHDGGGLVAAGGGNLVAAGGGNIISHDGGGIISHDGGGLVAAGGGNLIAVGGGNLVAAGGGNLVAAGGGNRPAAGTSASADATTGFVQSGGEVNLSLFTVTGPMELDGGTLTGSGLVFGDLTNNGGYISPGHSAGGIGVNGNFTQGANGTLAIEDGGATSDLYDTLDVTGAASLGGKLDVKLINGYQPDPADTFNPVGYTSLSGAFASTSSNAQVTTNPSGLLVSTNPAIASPAYGQPQNISTRMEVLTSDNVLIGGFIVTGPSGSTKKVLIRGIGPSLANYGLSGVLSDPLLEFHGANGSVITNDNWGDAPNKDQIPNGFAPANPQEAIILADLAPGSYTVIERGAHGETGIGLTEVYDLDGSTAVALGNISTRGFVDTGDNVMIGGFIVGGSEPAQIVVRATGPTLKNYGLTGVLEDPTLELHDANGGVISNDNWRETQEAELVASTVAPSNDLEPAILASLVPGSYTAIVRGKSNSTGIAIVEVYKIK